VQFSIGNPTLVFITKKGERGRPRHPDVLTPGEWRVAKAARYGMTNRQIAERLGISVEAVKFHLPNILLKLGRANRTDLLSWPGMPARSIRTDKETHSMKEASTSGLGSLNVPPGLPACFPTFLWRVRALTLSFSTRA
jgi:DNA-binding CsgD family transcriptional regulator